MQDVSFKSLSQFLYLLFLGVTLVYCLFRSNLKPKSENLKQNLAQLDFQESLVSGQNSVLQPYSECEFSRASHIHHFETSTQLDFSIEKVHQINLVWLHGLGGTGEQVFKKIIRDVSTKLTEQAFSRNQAVNFNFFLPTAKILNNPWGRVWEQNSWFRLFEINNQEIKAQSSIFKSAKSLFEFLTCVSKHSATDSTLIVGGASQGGALVWTLADILNRLKFSNSGTDNKNIFNGLTEMPMTVILANTWLPEYFNPIEILEQNINNNFYSNGTDHQELNNSHLNFNLIYNKFDNIITSSLVRKSLRLSTLKATKVRKIKNETSLHSVATESHINFIVNTILRAIH